MRWVNRNPKSLFLFLIVSIRMKMSMYQCCKVVDKGGSMREIIVLKSSFKARVSFKYMKNSLTSSNLSVNFLCPFSTLYFRSTCRFRRV